MSDRRWVVYALVDPTTKHVRYVGWTFDLHRRIRDHLKPSRLAHNTHRDNWLASLVAQGLSPDATILEEGTGSWENSERRWISHFRAHGAPLTNHTIGGEGTPGFRHSIQSRMAMSAKRQGTTFSPQARVAFAKKYTGAKRSAEVVQKIAAGLRGIPKSKAHREALSRARRGVKLSAERCAQMSAARMGVKRGPLSEATKEKIRQAKRKRRNADA